MTPGTLKMVFEPMRIGNVEIANRIVRTSHDTGLATPDITEDFIAYHEARARGGCGLTILEAASVHHTSNLHMRLFGDELVPGYERLMKAIRPHGMKVFQQLWHGGNLYYGFSGIPWAVSTVPSYTGIVGQPMTEGQIEELIDAFVQAALKAQAGGIDGVELHAAHGYIFHQFLTATTNTRTDRWGGDFAGRSRFLMETARAVRSAVGPDFVVGIRVSESEAPGGVSIEDNQRLIAALQDENLIDFVDASFADYFTVDAIVAPMSRGAGYELPSSGRVASVAKVPRIVAGRFRTLEEADQVIREGLTDFVSMVRAQIADPELVNKTRRGQAEQVRPCLGCNQGCSGGLWREGRLGCTVNPAVGRELQLSENLLQTAPMARSVVVIGGGPSGMEAARVAAIEGHRVTLFEAGPDLGGQVRIAGRAPHLAGLADIIYWQEQEIFRLGVEVRLNTYADADDITALNPDEVIVATGAYPRMDGFLLNNPGSPVKGVEQPHVISAIDLLTDQRRELGENAVVMESAETYEAIAVCEQLVEQGVNVTLVCVQGNMTPYAQTYGREGAAVERMTRKGAFTLLLRHRVIEIGADHCLVGLVRDSGNVSQRIPADTVVLVSPNEPMRQIFDELRDRGVSVRLVGDALSPRDAQAAIADGHRAARELV